MSPLSLWEGQGIRAELDAPGGVASGDVMGLLLRERIIFLGNEIEDFLADAVVSQLLLLDAMDSESDIRLFVNSPGGSLRSPPKPQCIIHFHFMRYYFASLGLCRVEFTISARDAFCGLTLFHMVILWANYFVQILIRFIIVFTPGCLI